MPRATRLFLWHFSVPLSRTTPQRDEAGANLADGAPVILAEIGNRLVVWRKAPRQPHHLDVAPSLAFQPAARLNPVEIAVNVKL